MVMVVVVVQTVAVGCHLSYESLWLVLASCRRAYKRANQSIGFGRMRNI
jgi:hypothetical protein